jgi:hypothetical protein
MGRENIDYYYYYYIQEINPEMLELAKFAKQHIPEEHELDDPDFVDKRSASVFCGSRIRIFHPRSRIQGQKHSGSRIRIRVKEF